MFSSFLQRHTSGRLVQGTLLLALIWPSFLGAHSPPQDLPPADPSVPITWLDAEKNAVLFENLSAFEHVLLHGQVIEAKKIPTGINEPHKLTLEIDGIRLHAIFRDVDLFKQFWRSPEGLKVNFRDFYGFERAAFLLSQLFSIGHVPPVVSRTFKDEDFRYPELRGTLKSRTGTLQAWVENAFTEKHRRAEKLTPISTRNWILQHQLLYLFDNLVFNDDRNMGNILIDSKWHLWFIDQTRAFRTFKELTKWAKSLTKCDQAVWERLQTVEDAQIRKTLDGVLTDREINTVIARREALVAHFQALIAERGEDKVILDFTLD